MGEIVIDRVDRHNLRTALRRLAQTQTDQRLILARIRTDQQYRVKRFEIRNAHTERRKQRCFRVVGKIELAQPMIDVIRSESAH